MIDRCGYTVDHLDTAVPDLEAVCPQPRTTAEVVAPGGVTS